MGQDQIAGLAAILVTREPDSDDWNYLLDLVCRATDENEIIWRRLPSGADELGPEYVSLLHGPVSIGLRVIMLDNSRPASLEFVLARTEDVGTGNLSTIRVVFIEDNELDESDLARPLMNYLYEAIHFSDNGPTGD